MHGRDLTIATNPACVFPRVSRPSTVYIGSWQGRRSPLQERTFCDVFSQETIDNLCLRLH